VSTAFFCDTSALVKLYHQEVGTERMEELFQQEENVLLISELAIIEFYSTLARKVRIGEITPEGLVFVSADVRQLEVGTLEGLQVLNPELPGAKQTA
jgi:predicted nucleic acid-binding protein